MDNRLEYLRGVVPNPERVRTHKRLVGTNYSHTNAMRAHRCHAKGSAYRAYHLREALRLRSLLRSGTIYYYALENGKTFPLVPFVPWGSELQYDLSDGM